MTITKSILDKLRRYNWIECVYVAAPNKDYKWVNLICVFDDKMCANPRKYFKRHPEIYFIQKTILMSFEHKEICKLATLDLDGGEI